MAHWYIKRPHAIERFKLRGGFPNDTDRTILESELRRALNDAEANNQLVEGCRPGQFAVRIAIPKRNVVYAIVIPVKDMNYTHIVPTVLTRAMYESWHDDFNFVEPLEPNLTPFETIPENVEHKQLQEKKEQPASKPTLYIMYKTQTDTETVDTINEFLAEEVPAQIAKLIEKGIPFKHIKVMKELPVKFDIRVGFTR